MEMKISNLLLIFALAQTNFLHLIAFPSTNRPIVNCGHPPGIDTSIRPAEGLLPIPNCGFVLSSDAIDISRNKDPSIGTNHKEEDVRGVIEDDSFQMSSVKFGEKKKPHILKSSKGHIPPPRVEPEGPVLGHILPRVEHHIPIAINPGHILPRVEPHVPTSVSPGHISPKIEPEAPASVSPPSIANENVFIPPSSQPSLLTNDFNTGDLITETRTPVKEEPISEEISKSSLMIPTEEPKPDHPKTPIPTVLKLDSLLKEKLLMHLPPGSINQLKDIVHHSKDAFLAHKDPAKPHHSIITSILHKIHHLKKKSLASKEHLLPPHHDSLVSSILHKKDHVPNVASVIAHKIHHLSKH